jgi:ribose transport system substrate-binding protein
MQDEELCDKVKVSGLGLPSENVSFIKNGCEPEMALWSFVDLGYLTYHLTYQIATGKIKGVEGDKFTAGRMGEFTITKDPTRKTGLRVLMGPFSRYNKDNIDKEVGGAPAAAAPAALENPGQAPKAADGKNLYIPLISKGFQHQFWQAVKLGSEKAAKDFGVDITFEGPETEAQVDKQMEMLQTAIDKKPAAICFAAVDSKAAIPLLEKAKAANIPVIGFDSGVDSDVPLSTASTDNIAAAALAADKMVALMGAGPKKVAIIAHDQTSRTGIDRVKGFTDQIKNKYPDVTIVDTQYGAGDQLKSTDIAKAIITANPDLNGFFGANEGSIIGVLNGVKELNKGGKIVVIGYDSGAQQIAAIKDGTEAGAITQDPIGIGYKCVQAAVLAVQGKSLPKTIDTGFHWFDKTNIDDPTIAALLYK